MRWAALALLGVGAASAAEPPRQSPIQCKDTGTTLEMAACARDAFNESDRNLNATYQALIRKEADNKVFVARLRDAQKAWIKFRDSELEAIFACQESNHTLCWGTMYPLDFLYHKKRLTDERQRQLQAMLDRGRP